MSAHGKTDYRINLKVSANPSKSGSRIVGRRVERNYNRPDQLAPCSRALADGFPFRDNPRARLAQAYLSIGHICDKGLTKARFRLLSAYNLVFKAKFSPTPLLIGGRRFFCKVIVLQKAIHRDNIPIMKKAKTFRLSEQAQSNLIEIAKISGANETAIIELSLAFFVNKIRGDFVNKIEDKKIDLIIPVHNKKKRKRH